MRTVICLLLVLLLGGFQLLASEKTGHAARAASSREQYKLELEAYWRLELPNGQRFDASGLLLHGTNLLTINDRGPDLYRLVLSSNQTARVEATGWFTQRQVTRASTKPRNQYDCEGIARDPEGYLYISEENNRAIYKLKPGSRDCEELKIDWRPVQKFFGQDKNASFEGIAIGGGKLWVANERSSARLIIVDLKTLKVEESFSVDSMGFAFGGPHYSDLSWFEERLYVLDRNHRCILEVDPPRRKVEREYNYGETELQLELAFQSDYPTGAMEGLAIEPESFWLITDNNGRGQIKNRGDRRPILFRFKRPERIVR